MDPDDRWVRIYVRQDRIGAVKLGQPASITSDTYRDRSYHGEVIFIANEAEFTPRNVQTTEERVKLVYAVKVRITGDPGYDLKPGIPADVVLEGSSEVGAPAPGGDEAGERGQEGHAAGAPAPGGDEAGEGPSSEAPA